MHIYILKVGSQIAHSLTTTKARSGDHFNMGVRDK